MKTQKKIVKIKRISNFLYSFADSNSEGMKYVARALTFQNPSLFAYSSVIKKYNGKDKTFAVGMIKTLEQYLKEHDVSYTIDDYNYSLPENVKIDSRMSGAYSYQSNAVKAFYKRRFGIIQVPTRGGKTFIASEIFRIFLSTEKSGNIMFVVDNTTLFQQAVNDIHIFFKPYGDIQVGEIRAGKCDLSKRLTVAMIQTVSSILSRKTSNAKKLRKYLRELTFLCVDEVHDNVSTNRLRIYRMCRRLEYQLCLSATPYRSEQLVQNLKLKAWSGDVCYTITEQMLIDAGALTKYKIIALMVDHNNADNYNYKDDYRTIVEKLITNNNSRNRIICELIKKLNSAGLHTLVLFNSVQHGKLISSETGCEFISGDNSCKEREEAKNRFLKSKIGSTLLASSIFKKGVTLPQAQVVINVDGGLEDANTIQRKGRILGATAEKKYSVVIDIMDICDSYLTEHTEARLNAYTAAINREDDIIILDTEDRDCLTDAVDFIIDYVNGNCY